MHKVEGNKKSRRRQRDSLLHRFMCLFHHDLLDGLSALGVDVHHVNTLGKVGEVKAHLLTFGLGVVDGLTVDQGSNLGLSHCRQILYHLSHQGSLKTKDKTGQLTY